VRELRFRAWSGREMRTDFAINSDGTNTANPKWEIMQFTGRKDRNGKEIYEGDILRWKGMMDHYSTVEFLEGCFKACDRQSETVIQSQFCEVIGNIYENPELVRS
jgi:uncharacterized phage protein (TIGR01671 family)